MYAYVLFLMCDGRQLLDGMNVGAQRNDIELHCHEKVKKCQFQPVTYLIPVCQ